MFLLGLMMDMNEFKAVLYCLSLSCRPSIKLTVASDVRPVPRSLSVDGQTLGPRKAVGDVACVAIVLQSRVQIEGRLFRQGVMSGMIYCRRR